MKDSPLLQLPHFTEVEVKHALSGKSTAKSLRQYIQQPMEERKGLSKFTEEQKQDVQNVLNVLPLLDVKCKGMYTL